MAGNLMKYYEQQIRQLTAQERMELANEVIPDIVSDGNGELRWDVKNTLLFLAICARVGIGSNRPLNASEIALAEALSEARLSDLPKSALHTLIDGVELKDSAGTAIRMATRLGQDVAMAMFWYTLCWAYADGVMEPDTEQRIENFFGVNLIVDFGNSGLESVPAPRIGVSGLEAEIVGALKADSELCFLRDIQAHFPNRSASEVKRALDHLCEEGVLSCVGTFAGDMYVLENAD